MKANETTQERNHKQALRDIRASIDKWFERSARVSGKQETAHALFVIAVNEPSIARKIADFIETRPTEQQMEFFEDSIRLLRLQRNEWAEKAEKAAKA